MASRRVIVGVMTVVLLAFVVPCAGMDLGLFVGNHSAGAYVDGWVLANGDLQTGNAVVTGVQGEQRLGNVVAGLRVGLLSSLAQSVWVDGSLNQHRASLLGAHGRLSGALRNYLLTDVFAAQAGIALGFDYYRLTSWGETELITGAFTESMTTGLRVRPSDRVTVGLDVDLDLARQGLTHYFFSDTGPSPFWVFRVGTIAPSVVLGASLSL